MKKIVLLGSDPELVARMRSLLAGMVEIVGIENNDPNQVRVVIRNGVVNIEGDTTEYTFEEIEEMKREFEDREALRKGMSIVSGFSAIADCHMCEPCQERDWGFDERAYNLSQVNMMRRRDQHRATVQWQHVRPVKAHKAKRNSVRGRR